MKLRLAEAMMVLGMTLAMAVAPVGAQQAPQGEGVTPEQMAKAKNVPAVLEDPAGNYQLVAVIEGADANRKLTQNLQVVGAQRQRLLALSQQFDRMPADAFSQRELVAEEILKVRKTLQENLKFMAQAYGYSLRFNYRLVPHAATLLLVSEDGEGEDKKLRTEVVHEFKDATTYEEFQALREEYLLQTVAEAKEAAAEREEQEDVKPAVEGGESGLIADEEATDAPEVPDFEPSAELQALGGKLIELYDYDPQKNYQINLEKTALYARNSVRQ